MAVSPVNQILSSFESQKLANILNANTLLLQKSLERLTTGLRIVDAGDDARGAGQVVKLDNQIHRLSAAEQAIGNASDYVQSQSDFLSTVSTKLSRMSELTALSQDTTTTADQRTSYQNEFSQIQVFISTIGTKSFNSVSLFGVSLTTPIDQNATPYTLQAINYFASSGSGGISNVFSGIDVSTTGNAATAQTAVSLAIQNLGILQAKASATSNYLTDSNSLLTSLQQNLQSTLDRVQKTDTTTETVNFNNLSLLTQTGQTMLANYQTIRMGLLNLLKL